MKLNHGLHLAYCTNIHRGETWAETFAALQNYTLSVRQLVCANQPYGIGLRLSNQAARELSQRTVLVEFQKWLAQNRCYVFTLNGFPFGQFHGGRVKEQVYLPDWTSEERLSYTNLLFDLLAQLVPAGVDGSVSTVPCGFKQFVSTPEELRVIRGNVWRCIEHIARVSSLTGRKLHLALEPEPLCLLETSSEVAQFFDRLRAEHRRDERLEEHLGVNYDTCHLAVEFEEPQNAVASFQQHGIKLNKIHLSSALKLRPTAQARDELAAFLDPIYLHQVVICRPDGHREIYLDLDDALACEPAASEDDSSLGEWRIHFHVPLYGAPGGGLENTSDHVLGILDLLQVNPGLCPHLEIETYTWEVLPEELKAREVVEQIVAEYEWTLARLRERGLAA
jgi:hypothetical protein